MRYKIYFIVFLVFLTGCAGRPFSSVELIPLENVEPNSVVDSFKRQLPEKFSVINTINFRYRGRRISGLGYTRVNTAEKDFAVVCLNPAGIKLFEIQSIQGQAKTNFVLDELSEMGDIAERVSKDLKRIYFHIVPSEEADFLKTENKVIFKEDKKNGRIKYVFGGRKAYLISRTYSENQTAEWEVFYYNWQKYQDKLYPEGIVFKNHKYQYELAFKLKEVKK